MLRIRKRDERGHFDHGWLNTYHTFSFGEYHDPAHMGFRALRVMNEDFVQPGRGFGTHPHRDMEIVTCVLEGALEHRDSLGNGEVLRPGEFQRMSAGTGIRHSEFNPSTSEPVHLYQIWLLPERPGLEPSYEQKAFDPAEQRGKLRLVASRGGTDGSLHIHQDARIYLGTFEPGKPMIMPLDPARHAWLQVLRGEVNVNGLSLKAGDGLAVSAESELTLSAEAVSELMLFDLA